MDAMDGDMKNIPHILVALAALFAFAGPAAAEATNANGPRSLAGAETSAAAAEPRPVESRPVEPRPVEPPPAPDHEQSALGMPNGLFSTRPSDATSEVDEPGPIEALDPRRNDITRMILGMILALAVVLGLAAVVRVVLRRASGVLGGGGRPAGVLEILARYPVARGQSLLVLKVARRVLIVHHGGSGMTTLSEITDGDEVAALLARMESGSRARDAVKFRRTLKSFEREHERLAETSAEPVGTIEVVDLTRPARRPGRHPARRRLSA